MNKELLDFMLSISDDNYQDFMNASTFKIQFDSMHETISDYSWLDVIERYIPFLKNSIDNPYQDFLETTDSKKLYENRFLVSLITKTSSFLTTEYKKFLEKIESPQKKVFKLTGKTILSNEEVDINLEISKRNIEKNDKSYGLTIKERIERIIELINTLINKPFFITIKDASLVSSPIHKTNVILEDQNFKKLLELWGFIENYMLLQKTFSPKEIHKKQEEELKKDFYNNYFISYQTLNRASNLKEKDESFYKEYLEHLVTRLIEDSTMDEKTFKKIINKKFEDEYIKKRNREKSIHSIFTKSIDNYQKQVKDAIRALK
jgi:hypothetical protein